MNKERVICLLKDKMEERDRFANYEIKDQDRYTRGKIEDIHDYHKFYRVDVREIDGSLDFILIGKAGRESLEHYEECIIGREIEFDNIEYSIKFNDSGKRYKFILRFDTQGKIISGADLMD